MTEAVGVCMPRTNTEGFGIAKCTLDVSTEAMELMDLASSPSRAR